MFGGGVEEHQMIAILVDNVMVMKRLVGIPFGCFMELGSCVRKKDLRST